jgi:hypothetical protein
MKFDDYEWYDNAGNPQWGEITPDWSTGANLQGTLSTVTSAPLNTFEYTGIATSTIDKNVIYAACSKVPDNPSVKVIKYNGYQWSNDSYGIPTDEYPTALIVDPMSNDGLYLVTERGIYYKDASMVSWIPFSSHLPKMYGDQLEINDLERTLRIGTRGRGIWKSSMKCPEDAFFYETGIYPASEYKYVEGNNIVSIATVQSVGSAGYKSNTEIRLSPGFKATTGSNFRAVIVPCEASPAKQKANDIFTSATTKNLVEHVFTETDINVFPNPSTGEFNIVFEKMTNHTHLSLYSLQGKEIPIQPTQNGNNHLTFNLSGHPKGIYLLKLTDGDSVHQKKIILQ